MTLQPHQPSIPLLTQNTFTAVTLPDHVDIVIRNDRWRLDLAARERMAASQKAGSRWRTAGVGWEAPDAQPDSGHPAQRTQRRQ